ncbi:hypothetical protein KC222_00025 [Cedecea davisae]|uniref:Uncharacterized protein n=1 Tax=Cedecea davisae TaxID=158484 RepID=A0ABS6DC20_9ENTR|nr:hypothetical protein [Cedecea davisae]MBU4680399.1 hypothetical protein [Cedecea davisae]MBU4685047.1 hypothetical protein [Cedecea davisae]
MAKQLEALIARAKHIVENGGLLARDTSLQLIAALEQSQGDVHEANARNDVKCAQLCKQDEEIATLKQRVAELEDAIRDHSNSTHFCEVCGKDDPCATDDVCRALDNTTTVGASPLAVKLPPEINPGQARSLFSIEIDEDQAGAAADGWNSCLKAIRAAGGTVEGE